MKAVGTIAFLLVIIGGLNWGLYAFGFDLVAFVFGGGSIYAKLVYGAVGVAAVYHLVTHYLRTE